MESIKEVADELKALCGDEYEIKPSTNAQSTKRGWTAKSRFHPFEQTHSGYGETWEEGAEALLENLTSSKG